MKIYNKDNWDSSCLYRNIPNTRRSGIKYEYSEDEKIEWFKCKDIIELSETLNLNLLPYQIEILNSFKNDRFIISLKQCNITLLYSLFFLHSIICNDYNILICSDNMTNGKNILKEIKKLYCKLPNFMKIGLKKFTDDNIWLENGSSIRVLSSDPRSLSIGMTYDCIFLDNFGVFKNSECVYSSIVPVISSHNNSKLILNSDVNGNNFFYKLFIDGERDENDPQKNLFKAIRNSTINVNYVNKITF